MLEKVGIPCPRCDKRFLSPLTAVSHLLADHPHKVGWRQPRTNQAEVRNQETPGKKDDSTRRGSA